MIHLAAIISGGQTGADRGALEAAIDLDLGFGGWAPFGWRSEDGTVPEIYRDRMGQTKTADYGMRTRLNVQDSDGTLLISFAETLTGGSHYTAEQCRRQRKPSRHLVLPAGGKTRIPDAVRTSLLEWIAGSKITVLNVAGPRESKERGLQQAVRDALVWVFEDEVTDVDAPVSDGVPVLSGATLDRLAEHDAEPIEETIARTVERIARIGTRPDSLPVHPSRLDRTSDGVPYADPEDQ